MALGKKDPMDQWKDPTPNTKAPPPKPLTYFDRVHSGESISQIIEDFIIETYGELKCFARVPARYTKCELAYQAFDIEAASSEEIEDLCLSPPTKILAPTREQMEAIEFCKLILNKDWSTCRNRDTLDPMIGANFMGKPGCGKTHIMAAFANEIHKLLDTRLSGYRELATESLIKSYKLALEKWSRRSYVEDRSTSYKIDIALPPIDSQQGDSKLANLSTSIRKFGETSLMDAANQQNKTKGSFSEEADPRDEFDKTIYLMKSKLLKLDSRPNDFFWLNFDEFCELCLHRSAEERESLLSVVSSAKIVFIDDIHPRNDPKKGELLHHLIERRYDSRLYGTFMTTNLSMKQFGQNDELLTNRLESRFAEMLYQVDFKDSIDWRVQVNKKRSDLVRERIKQVLSEKN